MKRFAIALAIFAGFSTVATAARAASITYSFTGGGGFAGTSFTFVDPSGFLSFDTGELTPTTSSDLIISGSDYGKLTGFDFINAYSFELFSSTISVGTGQGKTIMYQIGALTNLEPLPGGSTLSITTPAVSATPEPSSLLLLGTGALGMIGARRRFRGTNS